jgi:predicted acylesterase/phospholipase RssA
MIIKYSIDDIINFIDKFNFNKIYQKPNIETLFENYGVNTGSRIIILIQTFLYNKYNIKDITFLELYNKTKKYLGIVGSNLTKKKEELFSYKNTPNMSVIKAIRISISIPFIFTLVEHNNYKYVDGGIVNNFPINYCNPKTTIGINLVSNKAIKCNNFMNYIIGIKDLLYTVLSTYNKYNKNHVIEIGKHDGEYDGEYDGENEESSINKIENHMNQTVIEEYKKDILIRRGIYQTIEFCKNSPVLICYNILKSIIQELHTLEDLKPRFLSIAI